MFGSYLLKQICTLNLQLMQSVECTTFAPATIVPVINANVKRNPNPNPNPNLNQ